MSFKLEPAYTDRLGDNVTIICRPRGCASTRLQEHCPIIARPTEEPAIAPSRFQPQGEAREECFAIVTIAPYDRGGLETSLVSARWRATVRTISLHGYHARM